MPSEHKKPNHLDPLSEPTLNRRLWAAYLHRRMTRAGFARAVGVMYKTAFDWDRGVTVPSLDALIEASLLLDFTIDELVFARRQRKPKAPEAELTVDQIKRLLRELRATREQAEALAEHARSAAGQYQSFTRSYVAAFVDAFAGQLAEGVDRRDAIPVAVDAAINARTLAEGVAAGAGSTVPPISDAELGTMGEEILADHAAADHASKRVATAEPAPRPRLVVTKKPAKKAARRRQRA